MATVMAVAGLAGCSSDPLEYRVSDDVIGQLPADKLQSARKIKAEVDAAKQKWEIAKKKQKLVQLEFEAAQKYARAAKLRLKAVGEKLALQNKGVPMDLPPGALEEARTDRELAKKNLEYRRLLAELHEMRVKQFYMKYHSLRADYFEKVVEAIHAAGHEAMKENKKSDFVRQAAERKTLVAETLEEVERSEAAITSLKKTVEPEWAPRLSCKPTSQQPVAPAAGGGQGGGTTPAPDTTPGDAGQPDKTPAAGDTGTPPADSAPRDSGQPDQTSDSE
jgi:formylglycine-generating enzyme required for sulfatase activity